MKISLIGDIALNDLLSKDADLIHDKFKVLKDSSVLTNSINICNLETPIHDSYKVDLFRSTYRVTTSDVLKTALEYLKIDIVSIANNHILDAGIAGVSQNISFLNANNILHSGIRSNSNNLSLSIYKNNEVKIGFLAYVHSLTNPFAKHYDKSLNIISSEGKINGFEEIKVKNKLDLLILSIHWGSDYSNYFDKWQQKLAHNLIDNGVDVIMGHHPHTIQPYEIYKNKPIFYSLGGLCFGDFYWEGKIRSLKRKTKLGAIAVIDENAKVLDIIATKEKKGNYIYLPSINLKKKLKRLYWWNRMKNKYMVFRILILLKETIIDRLYEFIWGYYRSPFNDLFQLSNFKKIRYILRDLNK